MPERVKFVLCLNIKGSLLRVSSIHMCYFHFYPQPAKVEIAWRLDIIKTFGNSKYKLSGDQFSYLLTLILILILSQRLNLCYDWLRFWPIRSLVTYDTTNKSPRDMWHVSWHCVLWHQKGVIVTRCNVIVAQLQNCAQYTADMWLQSLTWTIHTYNTIASCYPRPVYLFCIVNFLILNSAGQVDISL